MALGACASCPGLPLRIIPVGINYFRGHRFRSRVFIDVGEAIIPSKEQVGRNTEAVPLLQQPQVGVLDGMLTPVAYCSGRLQSSIRVAQTNSRRATLCWPRSKLG